MRVRGTVRCAIIVMICANWSLSAHASPILFSDRDAFNTAAQPQPVPFGATIADCNFNPTNFTCSYTFDNLLTVVYDIAGIGLQGDSLGLGFFNGQSAFDQFLRPVTAIGFDLVNVQPFQPGQAAIFSFAGTQYPTPLLPGLSPLFFGAIFDMPVTSIPAFASSPGTGIPLGFEIQDLAVTTTTPEPASLLLLGTGVIGAAVRRYRCRRLE